MNRPLEDIPVIFRNKKEFEEYKFDLEKTYGKFKDVKRPLDYPCMGFVHGDPWDGGPDLMGYYFYMDDARELYAAKFLEVA